MSNETTPGPWYATILPTEKDAWEYIKYGYFGWDEHSSIKEGAFTNGVEWATDFIKLKFEANAKLASQAPVLKQLVEKQQELLEFYKRECPIVGLSARGITLRDEIEQLKNQLK